MPREPHFALERDGEDWAIACVGRRGKEAHGMSLLVRVGRGIRDCSAGEERSRGCSGIVLLGAALTGGASGFSRREEEDLGLSRWVQEVLGVVPLGRRASRCVLWSTRRSGAVPWGASWNRSLRAVLLGVRGSGGVLLGGSGGEETQGLLAGWMRFWG